MNAAVAAAPKASRLAAVEKKRLRVPTRFVIYGVEGIGKSSLAAGAPSPVWIDADDGTSNMEVARYPFHDGPGGHVPRSYAEILGAVDDLTTNEHAYQTLVIDTADRLEALIHIYMLERDKPKPAKGESAPGVHRYGYNKGYDVAVDEFRALCVRLDRLRSARGMSIVILAHAQIRNFKNPLGDDYDRYNLRLNDKAAGFLKEWADVVGFARFEETTTDLHGERARGVATGRRVLMLQRDAAWDAKTRYAMAAEVEMSIAEPWAPLAKALEQAMGMDLDALIAAINAECLRIGDPATTATVSKLSFEAQSKGDTAVLHRYLVELKNRPATTVSKEESK